MKVRLEKISIIGVGLMGGSLALAIKKVYPNVSVWGYARSEKSYRKLNKLKLVDEVSVDLNDLLKGSNMIILATPVLTIIDYFKRIAPFLEKESIVIDLGSTKFTIEKMAKKYLPKYVNFVGCHPLCGSNRCGPQNAYGEIYKGSVCIITSLNKATPFVKRFWEKLGCKVYFMSPSLHDKVLSYVSHLPHVVSYALSCAVPKKYFVFSSGSFRDVTRISASSPQIWHDVFLSNNRNVIKQIDRYIKVLESFRKAIKNSDTKGILKLIRMANKKHICI